MATTENRDQWHSARDVAVEVDSTRSGSGIYTVGKSDGHRIASLTSKRSRRQSEVQARAERALNRSLSIAGQKPFKIVHVEFVPADYCGRPSFRMTHSYDTISEKMNSALLSDTLDELNSRVKLFYGVSTWIWYSITAMILVTGLFWGAITFSQYFTKRDSLSEYIDALIPAAAFVLIGVCCAPMFLRYWVKWIEARSIVKFQQWLIESFNPKWAEIGVQFRIEKLDSNNSAKSLSSRYTLQIRCYHDPLPEMDEAMRKRALAEAQADPIQMETGPWISDDSSSEDEEKAKEFQKKAKKKRKLRKLRTAGQFPALPELAHVRLPKFFGT